MYLHPAVLALLAGVVAAVLTWVTASMASASMHRRDRATIDGLLEAIRLTQEYVQLPAVDGWSWWDVYRRHRPRDANRLRRDWLLSVGGRDVWNDAGEYVGIRMPDRVIHTDVPAPRPAPSDDDLVPVTDRP